MKYSNSQKHDFSLQRAWAWRERLGMLGKGAETECFRIFYGPGEATLEDRSLTWLSQISIDRFGWEAWITVWEGHAKVGPAEREVLTAFLKSKGFEAAVVLDRPRQGIPHQPEILFGNPVSERKVLREDDLEFRIQLMGSKHPGLFLDHRPLRQWLVSHSKGLKVLNTFSYTGSLSVAAAVGGAREVHTLDLSRPTIEWAKENWDQNRMRMSHPESGKFWVADFFEWKTKQSDFDVVILDPPSFSRGEKKTFSTAKDLVGLHLKALQVLSPEGGILVTSINSANVSIEKYRKDVLEACKKDGRSGVRVLKSLEQPESFTTSLEQPTQRYLKGWILEIGGR